MLSTWVLILISDPVDQVLVVSFLAESVERSNCASGAVVPMPTLPALVIRICSVSVAVPFGVV